MTIRRRNSFSPLLASLCLFTAALEDAPPAGGAAPPAATEPPPATPEPPVPAPAAAAPVPKLTVLQSLQAAIASKGQLQIDLTAARTELTESRAAHALEQTAHTATKALLATAQADLTAARADVTRLTGEARTVAETVAQLGFDVEHLPEQLEGAPASTADDLQTAYAAEKDPEKKAQIFERIKTARAAEKAPKNPPAK